jgi:hypothetical protein
MVQNHEDKMLHHLDVYPTNLILEVPIYLQKIHMRAMQICELMTLMAIVWLSSKTYSVQSLSRRSGMIVASIFLLAPIMHSIHWFEYLPKLFAGFLSPERGSLFLLLPISGFMFLGVAF